MAATAENVNMSDEGKETNHNETVDNYVMSWLIFNSTIVDNKTCFYFSWIII